MGQFESSGLRGASKEAARGQALLREALKDDATERRRLAFEKLAFSIDNDIQTRGLGRVLADILEDAERYKILYGA